MIRSPAPLALTCTILSTALAGCGAGSNSRSNYGSEDGLKIAEFVSYFNDYKADPAKFKKAFVGTAPSNWREYERLSYEVVGGSPKIDGANATAKIAFRHESSHEVVATKEWTFTKVGDAWKLKDAPLK